MRFKIVETDNFDGDYPDEKFVNLPATTKEKAQAIADTINTVHCPMGDSPRWWKVEPEDYVLVPGFEP